MNGIFFIPMRNVSDIDLNLLTLFQEIYRRRNITAAAAALGMAQPSASKGLGRLRRQLNDNLFVRTSKGVEPTPYAAEIAPRIDNALAILSDGLARPSFDPDTTSREFTLIMTDIAEAVILPRAVSALRTAAPNVRLRTRQLPLADAASALTSGDVDLAIGFHPQLEAGFYQRTVFRTEYRIIGARNHPALAMPLTLEAVSSQRLAIVDSDGTGHHVVEETLRRAGLGDRIAVRVPRFLSLILLVATSDLLAVVPQPLCNLLDGTVSLATAPPPQELSAALPAIDIRMIWQQRVHEDPANTWLRALFADVFRQTQWP